jgi:hypothetical protein
MTVTSSLSTSLLSISLPHTYNDIIINFVSSIITGNVLKTSMIIAITIKAKETVLLLL